MSSSQTVTAGKSPAPASGEKATTEPLLSAAQVARKVRHERARRLLLALSFWVGMPTLVALVYYAAIAADQYESVTTLMLRGEGNQAEQQAVMLREYALSRDIVAKLDREAQIFAHYQKGGDFFSRLNPKDGSEARYDYYRAHVDAQYESHWGVFTLRVRAFTGKDSQRLAKAILEAGRGFLYEIDPAEHPTLVVVAKPSAPTESTYPNRTYGVFAVFFVSLALFGIGSLLIAAVREHAQF